MQLVANIRTFAVGDDSDVVLRDDGVSADGACKSNVFPQTN
jgi:hypothetical protein